MGTLDPHGALVHRGVIQAEPTAAASTPTAMAVPLLTKEDM